MLTVRRSFPVRAIPVRASARSLPRWVTNRFSDMARQTIPHAPHDHCVVGLDVVETSTLRLVTATVPDAVALPALVLQRRTVEAYTAILRSLSTDQLWYPVRIWNWIPNIHAVMPGGIDRYMVFNAGRFSAYQGFYGHGWAFEKAITTATAVGHDGDDLMIQVLASRRPGTPVENPRQIRSYRYSEQFGPMPPCFARATLAPEEVPNLPDLFIGGTASVCGEKTMHVGDVEAQCEETLLNLAHLIAEGARVRGITRELPTPVNIETELRRFDSMRIYYVKPEHADAILDLVWPYVDHLDASHLELIRTDICRPELLVEIEGTATFS